MADPAAAAASGPEKGPYSSTEITTYKITGPIEVTITKKFDASHVPPSPPPEARDDGGGFMEALQPLVQLILQKLDEIRQNQNPQ